MLLALVSLESIEQTAPGMIVSPGSQNPLVLQGSEHNSKPTTMKRDGSASEYCGNGNLLLEMHAFPWDAQRLQGFFLLFMIILGKKQKHRNGVAEKIPVTSLHKNSPVTVTSFHSDSKAAFHVCLKPELLAKARSHCNHVKQDLICCTFGPSLSCNPSLKNSLSSSPCVLC